ncbi:cilia- and flagella-associated protein 54 [Saccopteryx leptura]|uniref:cilia- and flagella-associated protein 54 n=1 Tax=Saccopteryx leptura TaxID=249018 RepID=UPI00339CD85D
MAAQRPSWTAPTDVTATPVSSLGHPPTSTRISKSSLHSKASSLNPLRCSTCVEDPLPLAVFYGPLDAKNPLLVSCEKEIQELLGFMKSKKALATTEEQKQEFHRRCATSLFNIWNKYAPRLPAAYYSEKLVKVGDSLCEMKEYKLALLQCYGRYLQQFTVNFDENKTDVHQFKTVFFPKGFGDKTAILTLRALNGQNICNYQLVCDSDMNLQNKESVTQCLQILSSFRLIMQVALPQEHLCWIVYNGTIYIYTICRKLMIIGQSSKGLEYLLWASVCMESSVPLLSVRYLTWRATLYTAVCQCYYDGQAGMHGEMFARRALAKIEELRQLESISSSQPSEESRRYYREATIKMAVMIFKRGVYESRRKNKSFFRPKIRANLREVQTLPWPRTITERLLDEMFDSTSSRFLAVLEALSDSSRRTLQTISATTDEVEIRDVVSELFLAGRELLLMSSNTVDGMLGFPNTFLLQLIMERKDVISMDAAVKFIKLAFTYEEWSLFESAAGYLIDFLQRQDDPESKKAEKDLILLIAIEPLINVKKNKGLILPLENYKEGQSTFYVKKITFNDSSTKTYAYSEDIFQLAATLYSCVCTCPQNVQPDKEIVVDIIMFLWQRCKSGIQRISMSNNDYAKFTQKISTNKWIYLLWQINEVIHCYKMEDIDIVVVAEVALQLSEILESLGDPRREFKDSLEASLSKGASEYLGTPEGGSEILPILKKKPLEQLFLAYELLDKAIGGINYNRMLTTLPNGSSVIDHYHIKYTQDIDGDISKPVTPNSFMMDLHLELIQAQHRIAVVLLDQLQVLQTPTVSKNMSTKISEKLKQSRSVDCFTESSVINKIRKNKLSKAIYLMQKALLVFEKDDTSTSSHNFLMEAYSLIEKLELEQNTLYSYQKNVESSERKKSRIPPPPIVLSRTHCSVTLKPAPFTSDVKVSWYCILGCKAEGSFGKARLNNNHLPNSGEAIPADGKSIFEVKGLETNEKYVFAIAAYSSNGKLVGDAVGETTKPILVYPPLSAVTARMLLTQVAYQIGNYELAKKVFSPVWDYFVASPPHNEQSVTCLSNIMTITQRRLHSDILAETSSILLYLFLRNIFVTSDIKIKEENLFCDNIKGNEIFPSQQIARLNECERILVALDLSNYLNKSSYALQAVTQCYGLLAPVIYHNIVLVPVVQILIKCIVVLQGLPNVIYSKKYIASFESIQHMIACCIFYVIKILRSWKEYDLAVIIINYGKKMLDITSECKSLFGTNTDQEETQEEDLSKKPSKTKKPQQILSPEKLNEQLVLLEKHLLKLTKQYFTSELSGAEDPIFLYPIVLNWSVKSAVKEVMKFKQRPRFLEFFTQVMLKCMNDEKFNLMLEITNPVCDFLKRRNESLLGVKKNKYKDNILDTKESKPVKFKAAIMEMGKATDIPRKKKKKKGTLREFLSRNLSISEMTEHERNKRADVRKIALQYLAVYLNPLIFNYVKKKRFHQICLEEMPWKAQMNLYLAGAHFHLLLLKLGERTKIRYGSSHATVSFQSCDHDIFSLYNSGTVLPTGKLTLENYKMMLDFLHTGIKRKANLAPDTKEFLAFINSEMSDENVLKTQTVYETEFQSGLSAKDKDRISNLSLLDHFMKIFLYCRRAMILAHRGGFWTLLQNCCRAFWNFTQELQILLMQAVDMYKTFPISQDGFICTSVLPFCLGSELLIDMLIELQKTNSIEIIEEKGEFSVPSCYGNIKNDNGGSSLTFEHPLDDVNVVDLKWIHDFVLKSLELLYQVEKWEALVSLAIQFNIISHERYAEQVTPLLVYAQRQLLLRISKFEGPDITEQACARYEAEYKEKITCRNFIGKQLKVNPKASKWTDTEDSADFQRKLVLPECNQAKGLVCVPVDVTDTLRCFQETLGKSRYHNRSIRHSRKLLSLFLAQTQGDRREINNPKCSPGKTKSRLGTEERHTPTPPDLSQEHFLVFSSVEQSKLPTSQLGLVISSYHKTIDVLQASNQRSLKVQGLHELGNLLIFAGKKRAAFICWCQALDDIFRKQDVLHTWKEFGTSLTSATNKDYSAEFLSRAGIWGCLQGAVISAKIAQFIKILDIEKRSDCCILSALLFQGLLRTTLSHPKAERCYAQYEITQLLPGIELFSDRYRADVCSVVASLYYVIRELHFAKKNIIILPLIALYQYFVSGICQDLVRNLEARILKIEVLLDLRFFSEAFHEMSQIFNGKHMPSLIPASFKASGKTKIFQSFDSGKPLNNRENIQALDELMNKGLPQILVTIGHQHLLNKFSLVKAYFLISLAETINCVPENMFKTGHHGFISERSRVTLPNLKELCLKDDGGSFTHLRKGKNDLPLNTIKSVLLAEAEHKLNSLVSEVEYPGHRNLCQCSVGQLEIMVQARLQLAAIALQRHRAAYSAAIVFSILKLLQDSKLFKKKVVEDDTVSSLSQGASATEHKDDNEFLDPISLNSREYFNIHLWLRCCLALVTAFVAQIHGIGIVKENDMTDYVSLINEACVEAASAGDRELQAEFLMQAVVIGLQEKHLKADIVTNLQAIKHLLEGTEFLSPRSHLTLVRSLLLLDDLTKAEKFKETPSSKTENLNLLTQSHNILIEQMLTFGETIEFPSSNTDYASPLQPLKNVYLPHVMLLAKTQMRIGHTVAKQVYYTSKKKDSSKWLPALQLFETALKLCRMSATEEHEVEAEILFQKGKIECQITIDEKSPCAQLDSLCEAIQISLNHDQNSRLIRDSYLEIALLYLHLRMAKNRLAVPSLIPKASTRTPTSNEDPTLNKLEIYNSLAWIAVRAAAQVSKSVLAINLLIGKKNARTDKVSQAALPNIPEFATVDLLSSYTDYLLDNYQVIFQTSYTFFYQSDEIDDNTDARSRTPTKVDITWIPLLRYYIHLQRINNMSKLLASPKPGSGTSLPGDILLTSLFNSGLILRQKEMHNFLKRFLQLYSSSCIDEFPRELLLQGSEKPPLSEKGLSDSSIKIPPNISIHSISSLKLLTSSTSVEPVSSVMTVQALNKELCFQWYIPPLAKPPKETEPMVLLLYAYNRKAVEISDVSYTSPSSAIVGSCWVPLNRVISIHEKLSNLTQIAEISLPATPEVTPDENIFEIQEMEEKSIDTEMENMIIECCSEIISLFLTDKETSKLSEVPFDVSLPSIFNLESLFDLANGCIISEGSLFNWIVSIIP